MAYKTSIENCKSCKGTCPKCKYYPYCSKEHYEYMVRAEPQ